MTQLSQMTNETTDEIKWNKPGQNDVKDNRKKVHIDTEMSVWDVKDLKKQMGSEAGAMLSRFISQYNSIAEYQMDPESWSAKQGQYDINGEIKNVRIVINNGYIDSSWLQTGLHVGMVYYLDEISSEDAYPIFRDIVMTLDNTLSEEDVRDEFNLMLYRDWGYADVINKDDRRKIGHVEYVYQYREVIKECSIQLINPSFGREDYFYR